MTDNQTLKGRTAIVTGASSGIGRAIAIRLGEAGAHVFLAGRTESALKEGVQAVEKAGGRGTAVAFDARDVKQVQQLVDKAVKATGRLDIMVNNAGLEFPSSITDGDPERWREMLEVNVLALLVGSQAAVRAMRTCGASGHIVNISSTAGRSEASGVYGSTKWAVNSIATTLREELENDKIRVVNIMPGAGRHQLRTQLSARGRQGHREFTRNRGGHPARRTTNACGARPNRQGGQTVSCLSRRCGPRGAVRSDAADRVEYLRDGGAAAAATAIAGLSYARIQETPG